MFITFERSADYVPVLVNTDHVSCIDVLESESALGLRLSFTGTPQRTWVYFGPADMTAEEIASRRDVLERILRGVFGSHRYFWTKAEDDQSRAAGGELPGGYDR